MSTDFGELHYVYATSKAGERVCAGIVEVEVFDEQAIACLAEQRVEACGCHGPVEVVSLKWPQEPESVPGQWNVARPSGQVFSFVGDTRNATAGVYPRGSEGEDFAGTHGGAKADEEGESYFATLGPWPFPRSKPEMAQESPDFTRMYDALAGWVISGGAEASEGAVPAPFPLIAGDREDVAEKVDVALNAPLGDGFKALVTPFGQVVAADLTELASGYPWKLAKESVDALGLEGSALLPDADLVPVALESLGERLAGYGPTLHGQNFGLFRGSPETGCGLGLEHARLANSVPVDLDSPSPAMLVNVRHVGQPVGTLWGVNSSVPGGNVGNKGGAK